MVVKEFGINNKEIIVLLHGGGLSWWNYTDEIKLLQDKFHIIIPALDGHSDSDLDFTSIEDNAARIIKYIDEKFNGKVLLISGLSLGGQILLEILSQRNDICKFAIIESALAIPMPITQSLIKPSIKLSYGLIHKKWFSKLQMKSLKIRNDLFDNYYQDTCTITSDNYIRFMKSNSSYRVNPNLSLCQAKVLIFVGGRERPVMKRSAKLIRNIIPNSQMISIKDYHHGELSMNHADKYVQYMTTLIK